MINLFRFLAIAIIGYYVFKILMRFLIPILAKLALKKASDHMNQKMNEQMGGQQNNGEKIYASGKVEIRKPQQSGQKTTSSGDEEYIDFEEIKD